MLQLMDVLDNVLEIMKHSESWLLTSPSITLSKVIEDEQNEDNN